MIFVNFKTYKEATAQRAVELVSHIVAAQTESKVPIIPVVQATDARLCVNTSGYSVWIQHIDSVGEGQHTGWVSPESVAESGIVGTFLNHSEHKFEESEWDALADLVVRCKKMSIETMVFAGELTELHSVLALRPDYAAYEPPELIASADTSVARAKPEMIEKAVAIAKEAKIPLIVGAGVKSREDVETSIKLGAKGVAVSSAVVLSPSPQDVLLDLAGGFGK